MSEKEIYKVNQEPKFKIGQLVFGKPLSNPDGIYMIVSGILVIHRSTGWIFKYGCTTAIHDLEWWIRVSDYWLSENELEEIKP